jgi:radical SAM superfamily enzyme YgiQ (UPF0313 family)
MAKFLFITLYDEYCLGVRQLMAELRAAGHEAWLLCMKQYGKKVLRSGEEAPAEWQVELLPSGERSVLCYPYPITPIEADLATRLLQRLQPDIVGFSVYSPQIARTLEMTELVRRALPTTPVCWGGPHATLDPVGSAEHCDFVMVGEADLPIIELAEALDAGRGWRDIPSVAYRLPDGTVHKNPLAPVVQDLDSLPFTWHCPEGVFYIDNDTLTEGEPFPTSDLRRSHKIMTSRGCPYACTYCMLSFQKEVMPDSTKLRYRSTEHVMRELEETKARMGHFFLEIEDDIFTLRPERMEDFFAEYARRVAMPFWCYTHPQYARESMLRILRENNAQFVVMGIESGSNRVANEVFNRKVTNKTIIEAAHRIRESGLRPYYDLISNNPFETEEDRIETFHLVRSLPKPFELQLVELNFYPGIAISRMREERGLPRKVDFQSYRYWNALYHLASAVDLSDRDAERLLTDETFRRDPSILESMANEAKRLVRSLGEADLLARNYEREVQRLAARIEELRAELVHIKARRGLQLFLRISDALRWVKHDLLGLRPRSAARVPAPSDDLRGAEAPGQHDIVTEVTAPLDFREADEHGLKARPVPGQPAQPASKHEPFVAQR